MSDRDEMRTSPQVLDCVPLIARVYRWDIVGGHCHVVTDDGNVERGLIDSCLARVAANELGVSAGQLRDEKACLLALRGLDKEAREVALELWQEMEP